MNIRIDIINNDNLYIKNNEIRLKIYLVDNNVETDITNSKNLLVFSLNNDIVYIYEKVLGSTYRFLFKDIGLTNVYFVYDDKVNEKITLIKSFKVLSDKFSNGEKPTFKLEIRRENEKDQGVNNAHLLNSYINFYVFLIDLDGEEIDVTESKDLSFYSLDDDNLFVLDKMPDQPFRVLFRKEGTGFLKAIYEDGVNHKVIDSKNFICYTSFFKENYLDYLVGDFNKEKILSNPKNVAVFDTFMEMLDILYAYNQDLKEIASFDNTKSDFLDILAQNVGFLRVDVLSKNTPNEDKDDYIFRELLKNMVDLLSIRGTKAAYELFFGAIGYNISLNEFWYDENGDLVEIDAYDELKTTYTGYDISGSLKNNVKQKQNDPRKNVPKQERHIFHIEEDENGILKRSYEMPFEMPIIDNVFVYINCMKCGAKRDYSIVNKNRILFRPDLNLNDGDAIFVLKTPDYSVFRNAKSNYMRVNISSKEKNKFMPPSEFSTQKKKIINYYLDFLKPIHMQYLPELLFNDLIGEGNEIGEKIDFSQYVNSDTFKYGKFRGKINNNNVDEKLINYRVPNLSIDDNGVFDKILFMGGENDKIFVNENTYVNKFELFNIVKNTLDEDKRNVRNGLFDNYGKKCLRWDVDNISFDENNYWDEKGFLLDSLTVIKKV